MKITFDTGSVNQNVDRVMTTTYRETRTDKTEQAGIYALDISGTVMDNTAYKGHGKTAEEVMLDAGQLDVAVQRDHLTDMFIAMSAEDLGRMMEEGWHPGDMETEVVVTIVDTIKAELLKGGTQIAGYTDRIDAQTLEEITGSKAFAGELCEQFEQHDLPVTGENTREAKKAYDKAAEIDGLTEGAMKYMVENHMAPTIDNLYLAGYSSTEDGDRQGKGYYSDGVRGYYSKKAEEYNWQQLKPQMERVLEEAGLEVNKETFSEARWLIEKGIPLTAETVEDLHALNTLTFPQDEKQILAAIASAISDGKSAGEANLADGRSSMEKAAEYVEKFAGITDKAVDKAVAEGKELNLRNLDETQKQLDNSLVQSENNDTENITARRQLEEVRLMMTIEANRKLIESGYSIDTTDLEKLVTALRQIEADRNKLLFSTEDADKAAQNAALYTQTCREVAEIPYLPIDISGRFKVTDEDFTLDHVHTEGSALRNAYDEAREKYEALMTAPRADMGDSISKAFRNVDDILADMELETSEENRRAIRILGYNHMELSQENIQAVKASDMELRRVISKMTPAAVLQTIRDDKNPLEMTIPELNDYLDSMDYDREQEADKYSRFLYKLEKNNEIDAQEREAYIGIYRMLRQLEKTDDAAVGTVLNNGAELSFSNLLSAVRSNKKHGMNFSIDDSFGGIDSVMKNISITEQIESGFGRYFRHLAGETADQMSQESDSEQEDYLKEQLQEYRQLNDVEDSVINELLNDKQPVTVNNLMAADMLINRRGFLYRKLNELSGPADKDKVRAAVSNLHEKITDKNAAGEAYEEMQQVFEEILDEARYAPGISYIDLKAIQSCRKQLTLAVNLAQEENYHIPVEIDGEITSIHLKVLHGKEDSGKVKAALSTESYGSVVAEFSVRNNRISGYMACSTSEGCAKLQDMEEELLSKMGNNLSGILQNGIEIGNVGVIQGKESDLTGFMVNETQNVQETGKASSIQTSSLYQIAKAFISVISD